MRLRKSRWARKQALARPGRFYGDDGTIHQTEHVDVETRDGAVVSVWFRCQQVAFRQTEVSAARAHEMRDAPGAPVTGIQVNDQEEPS